VSSLIFGQLKDHQQAIAELEKAIDLVNEKLSALLVSEKKPEPPPVKRKPGRPRKT
jgi:hypothetical protein